ncbi:unnamed protein product, partial [Ceratitis capitata]
DHDASGEKLFKRKSERSGKERGKRKRKRQTVATLHSNSLQRLLDETLLHIS